MQLTRAARGRSHARHSATTLCARPSSSARPGFAQPRVGQPAPTRGRSGAPSSPEVTDEEVQPTGRPSSPPLPFDPLACRSPAGEHRPPRHVLQRTPHEVSTVPAAPAVPQPHAREASGGAADDVQGLLSALSLQHVLDQPLQHREIWAAHLPLVCPRGEMGHASRATAAQEVTRCPAAAPRNREAARAHSAAPPPPMKQARCTVSCRL